MEPEDLQRLSEQIAVEATESGVLLKPRTATGSVVGKHERAVKQGQDCGTVGHCLGVGSNPALQNRPEQFAVEVTEPNMALDDGSHLVRGKLVLGQPAHLVIWGQDARQ